jgi:riboflavin kinase/FMN adenylyltransferase
MNLITKSGDERNLDFAKGIGLGNFDGLHIGHMALINTLINESKLSELKSLIFTFKNHPENILRKKLITYQITSIDKKIEVLSDTKLDYLYFEDFDEDYSRINPEQFIKDILIDRLKASLIVVGFDYRFGFKGKGDVRLLKSKAKDYKYRLIVIPPVKLKNEIVSSTLIRNKIREGNMKSVFKLMGRHFSLSGKVVTGKKMGREIGFPTANILPEEYLIMPKFGVYITKSLVNGKYYRSITNVGMNPTFMEKKVSIETYIIDFNEDIYGCNLEVFFIERLRKEEKFDTLKELTNQINADVKTVIKYFNNIIDCE